MPIKKIKRSVDRRDTTFNLNMSSMSGQSITNLTTLDNKEILECFTISDTNLTLSGLQTINGVTLLEGSQILVNGQTTKTENGIYSVSSSNWERVSNDLNDVKLIKIIDGDYNTNIYTLLNEPVEVGTDDIEYVLIYEPNQSNILEAVLDFDTALLNLATSNYQELISGVSGRSIDVLSAFTVITTDGATSSGDAIFVYENGSDELFRIDAITGTGTRRSKLTLNSSVTTIDSSVGDGLGFSNPAATFTGTISGKLHLLYRYIWL